MTYIWFHYFNL